MGVCFHTFSSAVGLSRQCVMAELIRPCNKPASSESACLSSLITFNPVFWRKEGKPSGEKSIPIQKVHPYGLCLKRTTGIDGICVIGWPRVCGTPHNVISALSLSLFFINLGQIDHNVRRFTKQCARGDILQRG